LAIDYLTSCYSELDSQHKEIKDTGPQLGKDKKVSRSPAQRQGYHERSDPNIQDPYDV